MILKRHSESGVLYSISGRILRANALLITLLALNAGTNAAFSVQTDNAEAPKPGPTNFAKPPETLSEAKQQMHQMIEDDFSSWTGGPNRKLTIVEIGKLQKEARLTGAQAALIGSLALALDWRHGLVDRIGKEDLFDLADGENITVKTTRRFAKRGKAIPPEAHLKFWVAEYRKEFASVSTTVEQKGLSLWGDSDGPSVESIHQAQIGDCYWLSAVEAVVLMRPEEIKRTIHRTGPDTFELTFAGHDNPMNVKVTQADMAQFNCDKNHGCWLTALALGEARVRDASRSTNQFWRDTSLGVLNLGGSQCQVLHLLTGRKYKSIELKKASSRRLEEVLNRAMRDRIPIGLTSSDHTLSIQGYDPEQRRVKILNPWGTTGKYKLPNSETHVEMDNGVFEISLGEMRNCFATLNVPHSLEKK